MLFDHDYHRLFEAIIECHRLRPAFDYERDTIRKAQLGDATAWETLVRRNVGWILQTCSRWVRSRARAEDLTQDVFLRVFQTLHSYRCEAAANTINLTCRKSKNCSARIEASATIEARQRHLVKYYGTEELAESLRAAL